MTATRKGAVLYIDVTTGPTADRPAQWQGDFDKMLAYAASKGWMDAAGTVVKAHIEIVCELP